MSAVHAQTHYTPEEYLALERAANYKSEYIDGQIIAMAGGSTDHNTIIFNLSVIVGGKVRRGPCRGWVSEERVHVPARGLYTYPDLVFVCGKPEFDNHGDTLLNPTLIIEVLSPSTERYDRGAKFAHFQELPSLQEYILIEQEKPRLERYVRQGESWMLTVARSLEEVVRLEAIGCDLPLAEVYFDVDFPELPATIPGIIESE